MKPHTHHLNRARCAACGAEARALLAKILPLLPDADPWGKNGYVASGVVMGNMGAA